MMWWDGGGAGWGGWLVMTLTMVAFWGLLVVAAVALWRAGDRGSGRGAEGSGTARTPEQLLDERFARGEIDEEEYFRRRDVLRSVR